MNRRDEDGARPTVRCRRTGQDYEPAEHVRCPYCFGSEEDVARGDPARFCDYEPGVDPVSFGFPEESTRLRNG